MKIIITGANGLLGEKCTRMLSREHEVLATDIQEKLAYSESIYYSELDVTNRDQVFSKLREFHPDAVVHCAAFTAVDRAEEERDLAWRTNVEAVGYLVAALGPIGAHLVHISTDYVFDGASGPYRETDATKPVNYYGETKLASEELIRKGQLHATVVRSNVLFGNSVNQESSFVHWVIEKLRNREKIKVVNDQFGNPTWAEGLAESISKIIETGTPGLYHYGGANYINRFEFALEIAAVFELDPTLILPSTTRALGQKAERPFKAGLMSEKIRSDLNIKIYGIKEALTAMKGSD